MINITEDTIDRLMKKDGDFSKLYLYMAKNKITEINKDNKKDISIKTFISLDKMDYIVNYYKFNNILPKSFVCNIGLNIDEKETMLKNNEVDSAIVIELNNYIKTTFHNNLDYTEFLNKSLKQYDFDKDIYKYVFDVCSMNKSYQNVAYIDKILKDFHNNNLKTKDEIKNHLTIKNFDKSGDYLKERGTNKLSEEHINSEKKQRDRWLNNTDFFEIKM